MHRLPSLAKRLSAFLWLSIPDHELIQLADAGKLSDDQVLRLHAERMLSDPKAERFVNDFVGQWLLLDRVNAPSPDEKFYTDTAFLVQECIDQRETDS
ncbi:DUF1592 domain-containing protein [Rubripirellula lacrimiformis]|uniref:DUF1592 domain-containing protein n=1 Tax=Rubripirellula lacrimiformis TaxID=1930273 RepID=UPI001C54F944|nr:DUF1592 domain-containing protein [Rubripirellula lacrimiformis]